MGSTFAIVSPHPISHPHVMDATHLLLLNMHSCAERAQQFYTGTTTLLKNGRHSANRCSLMAQYPPNLSSFPYRTGHSNLPRQPPRTSKQEVTWPSTTFGNVGRPQFLMFRSPTRTPLPTRTLTPSRYSNAKRKQKKTSMSNHASSKDANSPLLSSRWMDSSQQKQKQHANILPPVSPSAGLKSILPHVASYVPKLVSH